MTPFQLLKWQGEGYPLYHQARINLLLHIVGVPAFLVGNLGVLASAFSGSLTRAGLSVGLMAAGFALQGLGHQREKKPAVPFTSPANAIARIFLEQWISFPQFVLTGGWSRAFSSPGP